MATTLKEKLQRLPPERQNKIKKRTDELIAEEMSLRDLRQARKLTQEQLAKRLKIGQESVSRIEKRTDLLLSTLQSYVAAMGGELRLVVEFPNRPPVLLSGISAGEELGES